MQTAAPELQDISRETPETLRLYGMDNDRTRSPAEPVSAAAEVDLDPGEAEAPVTLVLQPALPVYRAFGANRADPVSDDGL